MLGAALKILGSVVVAGGDSDGSNDGDVLQSIGWCFSVAAVSREHLY
jgi:hypothetical protein